jgi:hypothetical protein
MSHAAFQTYRPSGRLRLQTLPLFVAAIAISCAAAWLYQALMRWIPYIYLNFLLCAGFAFGIAAAGLYAVRLGHCRNRVVALILAVPLALAPVGASYYWGYRATLSEIAHQHPETSVDDIRQEVTFSRWLDARREAGWTLSSSHSSSSSTQSKPDISGIGVVIIWTIEALVVLAFTLALVGTAAGAAYCEACGRWCEPKPLTLQGLAASDLESALQMGDLGAVVTVERRGEPDPARSLVLTGHLCDGCSDTGFLSVDEKTVVQRQKKSSTQSHAILDRAILTPAQRAAFVQRHSFAVGQKLAG